MELMESKRIYHFVERLTELLRGDLRQVGAEYGLQPVQLEALHYLSICNRFSDTPMAVTEYLGQTKGTVSQTLKVLEKKGFLSKKADVDDKRISHLIVSEAGKELMKNIIPPPMFVNAGEVLTKKQQSDITDALETLLASVLEAKNIKTFGVCNSCRYNSKTKDDGYFCNLVKQPLSMEEIQLTCREHTVRL